MEKINVYKCHTPESLFAKLKEFKADGKKHPFSLAKLYGDADDWHGDPTYLLDAPTGYSTRPEDAIKRYRNSYNIIDVPVKKA